MGSQYTPEQIEDIKKREAQGLEALKALGLTPSVAMYLVNNGNDVFGVHPVPYLADIKYSAQPVKSPDEFLPPEKTI